MVKKIAISVVILIGAIWLWLRVRQKPVKTTGFVPDVEISVPSSPPAEKVVIKPITGPLPAEVLALASAPRPSATVVSVLGGGTATTIVQRTMLARQLSRELSVTDVQTLYGYLRNTSIDAHDAREIAVKNEVLNALRGQIKPVPDLHLHVSELVRDTTVNSGLRVYAVQHLSDMLIRADEQDVQEITDSLWDAVADANTDVSVMAMIALFHASKETKRVDTIRLIEVSRSVAADSDASPSRRMTAIQMARGFRDDAILPDARSIVVEKNQKLLLRKQAMSAIEELGTAEDLVLLQSVSRNEDESSSLSVDMNQAIARMSARLTSTNQSE